MSPDSVSRALSKLYKKAGIIREKRGNRFDLAVTYGFRKRFNTILKLNNDVNSNIAEKLMAHKRGLDGVYLQPTREECFTEFLKAIPFLTIHDDERMRLENEKLKQENTEKKQFEEKIKVLEQKQVKLEHNQKEYEAIKPDLDKFLLEYVEELGEDFFKEVFGKKLAKINL